MKPLEVSDTRRLQTWIAQRLGLYFEDAKLSFLEALLERRMVDTGLAPAEYLERLDVPANAAERENLVLELTVPETYFFRHVEQLNGLLFALPPLVSRARACGRALRILSAGCASGEEAYSLAMTLRESGTERDVALEIHGIDVNAAMIAKAKRGIYSAWSLRDTSEHQKRRWFEQRGAEFVVCESIRDSVKFEKGNLADDAVGGWGPHYFDVVFCRNVLMYFTRPQASAAVGRLSRALVPSGLLFLGSAETLRGLTEDFTLCQANDSFYYQLEAREVRAPPRVTPAASAASRMPAAESHIRSATDAILQRARHMLAAEQFTEALCLLAELPQATLQDADVQLLQAVLFAQSGELVDAERVSRELLMHDACNAGAHYLLALCRENACDLQGAIQHDRIAAGLDPKFAMPRLHLGMIARRSGDSNGARRELQSALALLKTEEAARLRLFGGGFEREALLTLCSAELQAATGGRR